MLSRARIMKLAAVCTFAIAGFSAAGASAQEQPAAGAPIQGWFKTCNEGAGNGLCIVQNYVRAETGQVVTAVGLVTSKEANGPEMLQVTVPTFRIISPGVSMQIDKAAPVKIDYAACTNEQCTASIPLTNTLVSALKRGGTVTFTSMNIRQQPNPVDFSLSGFTAAYDGEPVSQTKLVESQRNLDESIKKMAVDRRKKIEEAQKSTTGN